MASNFLNLSDRDNLIINALRDAEYNYLTRSELQEITEIPERTLRRLILKLENFDVICSYRSESKVIELC